MAVLPPTLVVIDDSAVPPPTTPLKVVRPVVFTLRLDAPSSVPPKVMPAFPVEVTVVAADPRLTASLYVWAPVVVTAPPLSCVVPAASVVTEVKAVPPPTAPPRVVIPAVLTINAD